MRTTKIIGVGMLLLFAMEVGYSIAIGRYEPARTRGNDSVSHFFKGPITSIFTR
jgi:hypothetical protein